MSLFLIPNPFTACNTPTLFIHLTKCGGTSIRRGRQLNEVAAFYDPKPDWKWQDSFAVVRNPYDRAVSAYVDFKYNRGLVDEGQSFGEWIYENHKKDLDDPGSAGHHCSSIHEPVHGLKHAQQIIAFEDYPFDRHERPSPGEELFKLNAEEKALIDELFAEDWCTYRECVHVRR